MLLLFVNRWYSDRASSKGRTGPRCTQRSEETERGSSRKLLTGRKPVLQAMPLVGWSAYEKHGIHSSDSKVLKELKMNECVLAAYPFHMD